MATTRLKPAEVVARDRSLAARRHVLPAVLLAPSMGLVFVLFAYPLGRLVFESFTKPSLSTANYGVVLHDSTFWQIVTTTLVVAGECTILSLLLAYPVAFLLASLPRGRARLLLIIVLLPFWTSILVRMYAWMVLLGREGVVNTTLQKVGVTDDPLTLLYTRPAVVLGMTHYMLPFMILSLYSTMLGIDRSLVEAARSMGSSILQVFWRVYFPLSLPGVYAGSLLVFILGLGFYVTPALLGSPHETTIAMYIQQQVALLNWGPATAMAILLLLVVVALLAVYDRLFGFGRLFARVARESA